MLDVDASWEFDMRGRTGHPKISDTRTPMRMNQTQNIDSGHPKVTTEEELTSNFGQKEGEGYGNSD